MVEDRDPRHMVCELRSALVPVALILSPLVEQVLGGQIRQARRRVAERGYLHRSTWPGRPSEARESVLITSGGKFR